MMCISREMEMMENTWNLSFKIMYNLPLQTHRYFVESISGKPHARNLILKRFLRFCDLIMKSSKVALKSMFMNIKRDVRSVTGSNLRKIMFMTGKKDISEVCPKDIMNVKYAPVPVHDEWKIGLLKELIDAKHGGKIIENLSQQEMDDIISFVSTS